MKKKCDGGTLSQRISRGPQIYFYITKKRIGIVRKFFLFSNESLKIRINETK